LANSAALLEPPAGRIYHGVQTMTYEPGPDPLAGYLGALPDSTIQPAVRGFFFGIPGERGPANTLAGLKKFLQAADSVGFIPEISLFLIGATATDSVLAASTQYDWIIDSIITLSIGYGKRMFVRIGGEFNGSGPGWNGGGYHPYDYVTMFRKIVGMYAARGFRDSIATNWCYEPDAANDFDSVDGRGARWYPGDDYVDWFGLDVFDTGHFDLALPDSDRGLITKKGKAERFLEMARAKNKPVFMSEVSAIRINITPNINDATGDWNSWFAKYWEFIGGHGEIKGFGYINANWPAGAYPGWGDARIQNSPDLAGWYRQEMRKPQYIHLPTAGSAGTESVLIQLAPAVLYPVRPNPFTRTAGFGFTLRERGFVVLQIFNTTGRLVKTLVRGDRAAGAHAAEWDGRDDTGKRAPYGLYLSRFTAGPYKTFRKMTLIR
jgi:hypothetical protein